MESDILRQHRLALSHWRPKNLKTPHICPPLSFFVVSRFPERQFSFFFFVVAFHRPLIYLSFLLGTYSNAFLYSFFFFLAVSRRRKSSRGSHPFSGGFLIFLYELTLERSFTLCIVDTSAFLGISQSTDLSDFSSLQIRPSRCFESLELLDQSAPSLQIGRMLLGATCQFVHPY